ncbi:MAG TPA: polysaccharide deacetylase family protein [candidate division Zixibacteria bacterium]|nr:polysaccharide deacetylase family protein [candidate division Zixibacteria bacterium]
MAVLAFHNTDTRRQIGFNNYHPDRLKKILNNLIDRGYTFSPPEEYLKNRRDVKRLCLTFDDGYEAFYKYAFPLLKELRVPAVIFVPSVFIGRKADWDYAGGIQKTMHLDADQISEISDAGFELGSHGYSHTDLTSLNDRMLKIELERSKKNIEELTGREIKYISYPFGRFNEKVEVFAAQCGYSNGFSLSFFKKSRIDFTIPRYGVYTTDTTFSILKKLECCILNRFEKVKGAIMNSYASGTILLNKLRSRNFTA